MQSETCIRTRTDASTLEAGCVHACAKEVYADAVGPCYAWESVDGGAAVRDVFRMSDACLAQYEQFASVCTPNGGGICASVDEWAESDGVFIEPVATPVAHDPRDAAARQCAIRSSRFSCEAALCAWNESQAARLRSVPCALDDATCRAMCDASEGIWDEGQRSCAVFRCTPATAPHTRDHQRALLDERVVRTSLSVTEVLSENFARAA